MKKISVILITAALMLLSANPLGLPGSGDAVPISEAVAAVPEPIPPIRQDKIPILMYHVLANYTGKYEQLYVAPEVFRKQLEYLHKEGYQTISLKDALEHWDGSKPLPAKPIILTFDDGYRSMYTEALPLLNEFGFMGTFFIHTSIIDTDNGLSTAMIREMAASGMEFGCHTLTHPDLTKISARRLDYELSSSKNTLEKLIGTTIDTLAYPSGRYNQRVLDATAKAGYIGAVTTQYGLAEASQNPFVLKRIRINKSDGIEGFAAKLRLN